MTSGPVIITGAGGFVCSGLALGCAEAGHEVIAIDRAFDGPPGHAGIRQIRADLAAGLEGLDLPRPGAVIHGAALTAEPEALGISVAGHLRANLSLHLGCLDWARSAGADRFLFLSSMGVFAPSDGQGQAVLTEADAARGTGPYRTAKKTGEAITAAAAESGFATLSLRLGNVFGPGERPRPSRPWLSLVGRMIAQGRSDGGRISPGSGRNLREWMWLPDLAAGIADLLGQMPTLGGVLHAGTPPVLSDYDLAQQVATRIPGATVDTDGPAGPPSRPPMASARATVLGDIDWTPIGDALDRLLATGGKA